METRKFSGRMAVLAQICDFVTGFARLAALDDAAIYAVQLAVDEAATNIIEHAYGGDDRGEMEITCQVLDNGLEVMLHDHGQKFDPDDVPEPVRGVPLEELKARGLGVYLMRRMMDMVCFDFTPEDGNYLTMRKYRRK